jgi:sec-independent protein translocase protein TatB
MFDFDAGKLIIIGIVALIVIGPKELPRVLRQLGQAVGKMRRMAAEFQGQFMEAVREADIADIKADVSKLAESAKVDVAFNPISDMKRQLTGAVDGSASVSAPGPVVAPALVAPYAESSLNAVKLSHLTRASEEESGSPLSPGVAPAAIGTDEDAGPDLKESAANAIDAEMQALASALEAEMQAAPINPADAATAQKSKPQDNA